ncbi:MAG: hypothetical protein Q9163_006098 [Psora crenata]
MPSFNSVTLCQGVPLTPPETYGQFLDGGYGFAQVPLKQWVSRKTPDSHIGVGLRDGFAAAKQCSHYLPAPAPGPLFQTTVNGHITPMYQAPIQTSSDQYGRVSAPLLPPSLVPERLSGEIHCQRRRKNASTAPHAKEEKVGGVAANLDYEMDEMVDFVSEMAHGMYDIFASKICLADIDMTRSVLNSKASPQRDFQNYVSQVLSSTRLPSSTILLGLWYLAKRMTSLSNSGHYGHGSRDVYSMLTTALMLGSKFLDDNTFQNRSWSEVSSIPVSDLNYLEIQWLLDIDWDMHIDQNDPQGLNLWLTHWERFQIRKVDESFSKSMRHTPIENRGQQRPPQRPRLQLPLLNAQYLGPQIDGSTKFTSAVPTQGPWATPHHLLWRPIRPQTNYSPPSAPETGPNTPDAYGLPDAYTYAPPAVEPTLKLPPALQMLHSNASQSGCLTPYGQHYNNYSNHDIYCDCFVCSSHHKPYFMAPVYGPQPVAA